MRQESWSEVECASIIKLRREGLSLSEIAERVGRTTAATAYKLHDLLRTPEEYKAWRVHRNEQRRIRDTAQRFSYTPHPVSQIDRVTAARLMSERDERLQIPFDSLTAEFCGDPRPGYSALDRLRLRPQQETNAHAIQTTHPA